MANPIFFNEVFNNTLFYLPYKLTLFNVFVILNLSSQVKM